MEQVSQLSSFVESLLQYHKQASQILEELSDKLRERSGLAVACCMLGQCPIYIIQLHKLSFDDAFYCHCLQSE